MSEDKYAVRINPTESRRMWYANKVGEVFIVRISDNPNAGYNVVNGPYSGTAWIARKDADLLGRLDEGCAHEETQEDSPEDAHTIALAQTVAGLRRVVTELSSQVVNVDYKAGQALTTSEHVTDRLDALGDLYDMLTDDIVTLDERTQPLTDDGISQLSSDLADVVSRTVTEAMRND